MKKFKVFIYIILIIIVGVLCFFIFKNVNKNNEYSSNRKAVSEVKYFETKMVSLLNSMNNIDSRNYNISISKIPSENNETSGGKSSGGDSGESNGGKTQTGSGSDSENQTSNKSLNGGDESEQDNKKFELKADGVLTSKENINWDIAKSEVENLYLSIPTMTMDLYNQNINKDDILAFNKEYDNLTNVVKDEKKVETLEEISKIYEYIPKFIQQEDEPYKTIVETKSNIFKAYSKLDNNKWKEISKDVKNAVDVYSKLLTNPNIDTSKQYNINKGYIMLNELQNAVDMQDTSVFLIKYKNILEEFDNI